MTQIEKLEALRSKFQGFTIDRDEDSYFWRHGGYHDTIEECHANRYATFVGAPTGANIYQRQVGGYASSPQRDKIGTTSAALRRDYGAASVRFVASR